MNDINVKKQNIYTYKNSEPLIAVIVPVYNSGSGSFLKKKSFIYECLDSVKTQTYKKWCCICINDGSTDNSLKIISEFAKKDKRFIKVTQTNSGVLRARINGIKIAIKHACEFITFLDNDDILHPLYLEKLINAQKQENADVVTCEFQRVYKKQKSTIGYNFKKNITLDLKKEQIAYDLLFLDKKYLLVNSVILWGRLFSIKYLKNTNFEQFDIFKNKYNITLGDDFFITQSIFLKAKKYTYVKDILYYNRIHSDSTASSQKVSPKATAFRFYFTYKYFIKNNIYIDKTLLNTVQKLRCFLASKLPFFVYYFLFAKWIDLYKGIKSKHKNNT
jgi:glycosyltransferase involved in cell wall biosynthesis